MTGKTNGVVAKLVATPYLNIIIENKGKIPIEFNYFSDECYYITTDEKYYLIQLSDGDPPYYPNNGVAILNPDETANISFTYNSGTIKLIEALKQGKVIGILLNINYGKTKIVLSP